MIFRKKSKASTNVQSYVKCAAFTLAEIMIVLGIVGIIAEITIPTLVQNVQEQAFKSAWKENFSILSQVATNARADEGQIDDLALFDYIINYTKYTKYEPTPSAANFSNKKCADGSQLKIAPTAIAVNKGGRYIELLNGAKVYDAFSLGNEYDCTGTYKGVMQSIIVDVNGDKSPNILGKDIFIGMYYNGIFSPVRNSCLGDISAITQGVNNSCDYLSN